MFSDDINLFESHASDWVKSGGKWVGYNEHKKKEALKIIQEIETTLTLRTCPIELKTSLEKNLQELRALL